MGWGKERGPRGRRRWCERCGCLYDGRGCRVLVVRVLSGVGSSDDRGGGGRRGEDGSDLHCLRPCDLHPTVLLLLACACLGLEVVETCKTLCGERMVHAVPLGEDEEGERGEDEGVDETHDGMVLNEWCCAAVGKGAGESVRRGACRTKEDENSRWEWGVEDGRSDGMATRSTRRRGRGSEMG